MDIWFLCDRESKGLVAMFAKRYHSNMDRVRVTKRVVVYRTGMCTRGGLSWDFGPATHQSLPS